MNCGRRVESEESEMANRKECGCNEKHSLIGLSLNEAWQTIETGFHPHYPPDDGMYCRSHLAKVRNLCAYSHLIILVPFGLQY